MAQAVYRFHTFVVDRHAHALLQAGTRLAIQEQPFQVLLGLLEQPGQVVTREALRLRLWGTSTFVDFDQSLNSAVRRLRMVLGDNSRAPAFVETIPRIGFRFLPGVTLERVPAGVPSQDAEEKGAVPVLSGISAPLRRRADDLTTPVLAGV